MPLASVRGRGTHIVPGLTGWHSHPSPDTLAWLPAADNPLCRSSPQRCLASARAARVRGSGWVGDAPPLGHEWTQAWAELSAVTSAWRPESRVTSLVPGLAWSPSAGESRAGILGQLTPASGQGWSLGPGTGEARDGLRPRGAARAVGAQGSDAAWPQGQCPLPPPPPSCLGPPGRGSDSPTCTLWLQHPGEPVAVDTSYWQQTAAGMGHRAGQEWLRTSPSSAPPSQPPFLLSHSGHPGGPQAPPHRLCLAGIADHIRCLWPPCPALRCSQLPGALGGGPLAWGLGGEGQVAGVAHGLLHGRAAAEGAGVGAGRAICACAQVGWWQADSAHVVDLWQHLQGAQL